MPKDTSDPHDRLWVQQTLSRAAEQFGENPRMIANRAVQLRSMLTDIGQDEGAASVVSTNSDAVGNLKNVPGFRRVGLYYVNLRKTGLSRTDSLTTYRHAIGPPISEFE